jgi:hypothetical protein
MEQVVIGGVLTDDELRRGAFRSIGMMHDCPGR